MRREVVDIVLCGSDGLAVRILEELHTLDERVTVIAAEGHTELIGDLERLATRVVVGDYRREEVMREAGAATADNVTIVEDDDVGNLHAALVAQDLNPAVELVIRMFNIELGHRLESLFTSCRMLSASVVVAPVLADAALYGRTGQQVAVLGHTLQVEEVTTDDPRLAVELPPATETGAGTSREAADRVLALIETASEPVPLARTREQRPPRRGVVRQWARAIGVLFDRRVAATIALLAVIIAISAGVYALFYDLSLIDAIYFTVTTVTTTGYGDINLLTAVTPLKLYGIGVMVFGALTIALLYAIITDAIVGARLAATLGELPRPRQDHVVVCGVGTVGFRVLEQLVERGVPCLAVDRDADGRFNDAVRELGVPMLIGDASRPETLRRLHVDQARSVMALTSNDVANLEIVVGARAVDPELRVIVRLFEPDLAARLERAFRIQLARSVSALATPAFVAAIFERRLLGIVPVGARALVVAAVDVEPGSDAVGVPVRTIEDRFEVNVLNTADTWRPEPVEPVAEGELVVVASRSGLARLEDAVMAS